MAWARGTAQDGWTEVSPHSVQLQEQHAPITTVPSSTPPTQQRTTSQLTLQGQSQLVAPSQAQDRSLHREGSERAAGVRGRPDDVVWDPHLPPLQVWSSCRPRPLACSGINTVSDPEMAVGLLRPVFTLRLRSYKPEGKRDTTGSRRPPSPV